MGIVGASEGVDTHFLDKPCTVTLNARLHGNTCQSVITVSTNAFEFYVFAVKEKTLLCGK